MTVKELINELNKIDDKNKTIGVFFYDYNRDINRFEDEIEIVESNKLEDICIEYDTCDYYIG